MVGKIRSVFVFDSGIDEIMGFSSEATSLPKGQINPDSSVVKKQLKNIASAPSTDERLEDFFMPFIDDTTILIPVRYKMMFRQVAEKFRKGVSSASASQRSILLKSADFLDDKYDSHRDLDQRRNSLLKG